MLVGCVLPLLLICMLPLPGISEGVALLLAIVLMFACHLLKMGQHGLGHEESHEETKTPNPGDQPAHP